MPYTRENIPTLKAYVPGEQSSTGNVVKLNTNENPYPPPPAVMNAIRGLDPERLRRYPTPDAAGFRHAAAQVHGVTSDAIIATNGGDELLRLAMTAFCDPCATGAGVAVAEPSYSLCPVLAAIHGTPLVRIPLGEAFAMPDDFAARALDAGCRLVMVVNPHAPSGRHEPLDVLRTLAEALRERAVLLVDEAYIDFASHDALPLIRDAALDNVLLLRSLSKGYSLAGLRFGYGIGHVGLIAALDKVRDSYNTDAISQAAATAALQSRDTATETWRQVRAQRSRLIDALRHRDWDVLDSESNFILATPPTGSGRPTAGWLYQQLQARAIFVRYFDTPVLAHRLRITIGTEPQIDALLAALDAVSAAG